MTEVHNAIIRASAGSGKTFQLVRRYLRLLALGEASDLAPCLHFLERAAHGDAELLEVLERLLQIVGGAVLDRRHRALDVTEGRDHDDGRVGVLRFEIADNLDAVGIGETQVDEGDIGPPQLLRHVETFFAGGGGVNLDIVPG